MFIYNLVHFCAAVGLCVLFVCKVSCGAYYSCIVYHVWPLHVSVIKLKLQNKSQIRAKYTYQNSKEFTILTKAHYILNNIYILYIIYNLTRCGLGGGDSDSWPSPGTTATFSCNQSGKFCDYKFIPIRTSNLYLHIIVYVYILYYDSEMWVNDAVTDFVYIPF